MRHRTELMYNLENYPLFYSQSAWSNLINHENCESGFTECICIRICQISSKFEHKEEATKQDYYYMICKYWFAISFDSNGHLFWNYFPLTRLVPSFFLLRFCSNALVYEWLGCRFGDLTTKEQGPLCCLINCATLKRSHWMGSPAMSRQHARTRTGYNDSAVHFEHQMKCSRTSQRNTSN